MKKLLVITAALLTVAIGCVKPEPLSERARRTQFIFEGNITGRIVDVEGTVVAAPSVKRDEGARIVLTYFYGDRHNRHRFIAPINERGHEETYVAQVDVVAPGEVRIYIETERKGGIGVPGSWTRPDKIARSSFIQQLPAGTNLEIEVLTGQDPADLRLRIDVDGDGVFEEEVAPSEVETGDDLDHLPIFTIVP
jgi:hypothetical protein